jgi:hypothetical protein
MDEYIENDKINAPFLLAASFNGLIQFLGNYSQNGIIYWKFSPKEKALDLIDQFRTKTEPRIPAKDLFEANEFFWRKVALVRKGGNAR